MELAGWIRATIWRSSDWCAELAARCDELGADPVTATPGRALELAAALELIDPDRRSALAMYLLAWRAGRTDALDPARRLAHEVREPAAIAELALAEHRVGKDAAPLIVAASAWIDAGTPERAIEPLGQAAQLRPDDGELRALLAAVRRELKDPHREILRWTALAAANRADFARAYLVAARIARIAKLDDIYANLLRTAVNRKFGDEFVVLLEDRLLARGNADELLEFYRGQLEAAGNDRAWLETVRAIANKLIRRGGQPGLALRLLRRSLEQAYSSPPTEIPGHLASWALLLAHARKFNTTIELMPLLVHALGRRMSEDERVYLARLGLAIAWRDARDVAAARPYATAIAELVPDHPELYAFMVQGLGQPVAPTEPIARPVPPPAPAVAPESVAAPEPVVVPPPAPIVARAPKPLVPPADQVEQWPRASVPIPKLEQESEPATMTTSTTATPNPATPAIALPAPEVVTTTAPVARPVISVIPAAALAALRGGGKPGLPSVPPLREGAAARATRAVVPIDLDVSVDGGAPFAAIARDISTTGLFIATERALGLGAMLSLELRMPGKDLLAQARFSVSAKVMRTAPSGCGVMLVDPTPELVAAIAAVTKADALHALPRRSPAKPSDSPGS